MEDRQVKIGFGLHSGAAKEENRVEWARDEFMISDDRSRVQVEVVADLLAKTFWAIGGRAKW